MSEHVEVLRYMRDPATQSEAELAAIDAAIAALSAQPAPDGELPEFEAMVERACVQLHGRNWPAMGDALQAELREEMRPVLTAAGVPELLALRARVEAAPVGHVEIGGCDCVSVDFVEVAGDVEAFRHLQYRRVRLLTDTKEDGE